MVERRRRMVRWKTVLRRDSVKDEERSERDYVDEGEDIK